LGRVLLLLLNAGPHVLERVELVASSIAAGRPSSEPPFAEIVVLKALVGEKSTPTVDFGKVLGCKQTCVTASFGFVRPCHGGFAVRHLKGLRRSRQNGENATDNRKLHGSLRC